MSQQLISRDLSLKRLRDEGYDVAVTDGYLVVRSVPYVAPDRQVKRGTLLCSLQMSGDVCVVPSDHVVLFDGEQPCNERGERLNAIIHGESHQQHSAQLKSAFSFSHKPHAGYRDYHEKMSTYAAILASPAAILEPGSDPRVYPVIDDADEGSPFHYVDTASSRAGIVAINAKLSEERIAIVGLGGTGSYVLDLVAKTPVRSIKLIDGDRMLNHNAFRCPGAMSVDELRAHPFKVDHFARLYSRLHRHISSCHEFLSDANLHELGDATTVFLCCDSGEHKEAIANHLLDSGRRVIDVGLGVTSVDDRLTGVLRVTAATATAREHFWDRVPRSAAAVDNDYATNIQVADLNALNAALAVLKWKQLLGFYADIDLPHSLTYTIDTNKVIAEDGHAARC